MSVVSWKRNESKVEYLYRTYELNLLIARIVASKSKKYKANYGDTLIKNGLDALKHLEIAFKRGIPTPCLINHFTQDNACLINTKNTLRRCAYDEEVGT